MKGSGGYDTCRNYCLSAAGGLSCVGAWEERSNKCKVQSTLSCDSSFSFTSDALCQCGEPVELAAARGGGSISGRSITAVLAAAAAVAAGAAAVHAVIRYRRRRAGVGEECGGDVCDVGALTVSVSTTPAGVEYEDVDVASGRSVKGTERSMTGRSQPSAHGGTIDV